MTADYSLMGALHAHMGRDPVPLNVLQNHAPRVFRWVEHARRMQNEPAGTELSEPGAKPELPPISIEWQGRTKEAACNLYHCWVTQRVQRHYRSLDGADRAACDGLIDDLGSDALDTLVKTDPLRWLGRRDNRLVLL